MKTIGLLGLTFVSDNRGCMALAYSFKSILECYSDVIERACIFSLNNYSLDEIDSKIHFEIIQISFKKPSTVLNAIKRMKECEIIFDFTEGDSFSDIYGLKRFFKISLIKELALMCSEKYILCPQTYGPFVHLLSRKTAAHIFTKSYYICSRDDVSAQVVKKISGRDIDVFTDVAFGLKEEILNFDSYTGKIKIGINISALLWNGGYNKKNQFNLKVDYRLYIIKLIGKLLDSNLYEVYLIPHVYNYSTDGIENDYVVSKYVKQKFHDCIIAPCFNLPSEIKGYISKMDFFVGARMHATIGAFSSGVRTIPFSYSRKFEGLYDSLNYPYLVNGREENTLNAVNKTLAYINDGNKLTKSQSLSMEIVNNKLKLFNYKVEQFLREK